MKMPTLVRPQRSLLAALIFSVPVMLTGVASPTGAWAQPAANQGNPAQAGIAQPPLAAIRLTAGMHLITAEVASTPQAREKGLMFRKELAPNHGMLFVFPTPSNLCFWMMNTIVPLSIAFMRDDGTIVNIADMQPMTVNSHCATESVRFALEMEQGWFAKRGITAGKQIAGLPK